MSVPADPKWRSRRWQLYYQPRAEYIKELYGWISWYKSQIRFYEALGHKWPQFSAEIIGLIKFDKEQLLDYQKELRMVVGR